jgi:5-formyltetrahydrofolate cyclo-ligase
MTTETDPKAWRRNTRKRLLEERAALTSAARRDLSRAVIANLDRVISALPCAVLGLYWPIKREIDLLRWAATLSARRGVTLALPVVAVPKSPLEYWRWQPADAMTRGFWNIPVPVKRHPVDPDIVIAPLVGFHGCWRLGYGGGYFDRTLAARDPRPTAIGIGFESSEVPEFMAEVNDIPMAIVVTERQVLRGV